MNTSKCLLLLAAVLGFCLIMLASRSFSQAEEKAGQEENRETEADNKKLEPTAENVEKLLVRYVRVGEDKYVPGYLGDNLVFYKFRDTEPLKESELPKAKAERGFRVVTKYEKVIEIDRPSYLRFVVWEGRWFLPAYWTKDKKTLLVFVGFRRLEASEVPMAGSITPRQPVLRLNEIKAEIVKIPGRD